MDYSCLRRRSVAHALADAVLRQQVCRPLPRCGNGTPESGSRQVTSPGSTRSGIPFLRSALLATPGKAGANGHAGGHRPLRRRSGLLPDARQFESPDRSRQERRDEGRLAAFRISTPAAPWCLSCPVCVQVRSLARLEPLTPGNTLGKAISFRYAARVTNKHMERFQRLAPDACPIPSVVSHKYGYEDARAFWSSARRDDL